MDAHIRRSLAVAALVVPFLAACAGSSSPEPSGAAASASPASTPVRTPASSEAPSPATTPGGVPIDLSTLGGSIVFSNGTEDIWSVHADGANLTRLTDDPANDFDPARSPDGTRIAFRAERDGNNEIYLMNADGSDQTNVSRFARDDWGPTWSPDGRLVLFNSARTRADFMEAWTVRPNGTALARLTDAIYVEYPAWSPEGTKIAFMSPSPNGQGFSGNNPNYDIFVMNADGTGITQLTDAPGSDGFPAWSPDGRLIAFSSARDDCSVSSEPNCRRSGDIGPVHELWLMNAKGSDQHRLVEPFAQFSSFSPDGRYVIFSPGLWVVRVDGTGLVEIPHPGAAEPEFADWTP